MHKFCLIPARPQSPWKSRRCHISQIRGCVDAPPLQGVSCSISGVMHPGHPEPADGSDAQAPGAQLSPSSSRNPSERHQHAGSPRTSSLFEMIEQKPTLLCWSNTLHHNSCTITNSNRKYFSRKPAARHRYKINKLPNSFRCCGIFFFFVGFFFLNQYSYQ